MKIEVFTVMSVGCEGGELEAVKGTMEEAKEVAKKYLDNIYDDGEEITTYSRDENTIVYCAYSEPIMAIEKHFIEKEM